MSNSFSEQRQQPPLTYGEKCALSLVGILFNAILVVATVKANQLFVNFAMDSSLFFAAMALLANADLFPFLFALVISIPSAALYCLELSVIITNFAHFSSPFFVLVAVRTILSLANYVVAFFAHRFGKIGLFLPVYLQLPRIVLAFLLFVGYYSFHVENLLTAFLLLNRCTAILCPIKYKTFWRRRSTLLIAVAFVLPLPFTVPIFNLDMFVHVQRDNVTFTLDDHKTENEPNGPEIAAWSAVIFGISTTNRQKQTQNDHLHGGHFFWPTHLAIFMIFVYLTATNFLDDQNNRYSLLQKWFGITLERNEILFLANFNQYPWVNDLATVVIPAWLLLWASTKMREIVVKKIKFIHFFERHAVGVPVTNVVSVPVSQQKRPIAGINLINIANLIL
uniref:Serpentine receptor class gamma n=1 Tax=Globodera rostochiensis TaxID=31243 RepID=A0A914IGD0_GLORO